MTDEKRRAREAARAARHDVPEAVRAAAGEAIADRVLALDGIEKVHTVLGYAATPQEADVAAALDALRDHGARIAYPRVCGDGSLELHWAEPGQLVSGFRGILEPPEDAPAALPSEIDLVLVPGTAFDAACCRLGQGGGCYDRLLPLLRPDALCVGIAFDEQLVESVPTESHDAPLDAVVTPTRTLLRA